MSKEGRFLIYCIEAYKAAKGATSRQVYSAFKKYGVIGYIREYYESLHTVGERYIVDDIDRYIATVRSRA